LYKPVEQTEPDLASTGEAKLNGNEETSRVKARSFSGKRLENIVAAVLS
jgi:hypothetical protein